jgi:SAM-dependent methyltransferase
MHDEAAQFLRSVAPLVEADMAGARVVEVGAFNVNGRARDFLPGGWAEWVGVDLLSGPDVNLVGDAATLLPAMPAGCFDIAVSTEALEHSPVWQGIVRGMVHVLRPGGWLIITCAGTGRAAHAADGSGPPRPGEWYENVPLTSLLDVLDVTVDVVCAEADLAAGDTRLVARVHL